MSAADKKTFNISGMHNKLKSLREEDIDVEKMYENSFSWQAISQATGTQASSPRISLQNDDFNFSGKVLYGGQYSGEDLRKAVFSGADLRETNFSDAKLDGADFSGADLSGANLSGACLNGAVFSGAKLRGTNFTGAKMNGVVLVDADIQDAILLDVEMDRLAIEELQALVEFLAVYYPHKLNLRRMNLTLLDFSRIDLSMVDLRGVDFTGVDFTGVNVFELDLSECIISPEQIAQALGRMPTPKELKQILAPKKKRKKFRGLDFTEFFDGRGTAGVWDLTKHPGITVAQLLKSGKQIYNAVVGRPEPKDEEILEQFRYVRDGKQDEQAKEHNEQMRKAIEKHKQEIMAARAEKQEERPQKQVDITDYAAYEQALKREREEKLRKAKENYEKSKVFEQSVSDKISMMRNRGQRERGG